MDVTDKTETSGSLMNQWNLSVIYGQNMILIHITIQLLMISSMRME